MPASLRLASALALFGRRPQQCGDRPPSRRPKTCTAADHCTAPNVVVPPFAYLPSRC